MDLEQQREKLFRFIDALPQATADQLSQKNLDVVVLVHRIGATYEFVLAEMGNICEGVLKVLKGEDSPSNLVAFIEKDERIEEDNRPKIPELAYEIQTKIFDLGLPLLKQAGFPIKEGRVAPPPVKNEVGSMNYEGVPSASAPTTPSRRLDTPPRAGGDGDTSFGKGESVLPPLDEKNIRALMRIAAGTAYTEEQLREAFESLPVGLRQSLSSVDTANAIQEIAKKYLIHVDQMASLASETGLVLLGLTHPADFVGNLARRMRLPEERAKEIAREVSAQIFVKVREALRNLHENAENPKSQAPNSKQISNSNIQNTNQRTTPADSSAELKAISYKLEASSTPYSAGAKWNTGENILNRQRESTPPVSPPLKRGGGGEGPLSRTEVLWGIENPQRMTNPVKAEAANGAGNQETITKKPDGRKEVVGPTGWKPGQNETWRMKDEVRKEEQPKKIWGNTTTPPIPPVPPSPTTPLSPPRAVGEEIQKTRPQSESATPPVSPPLKRGGGEEDFLDQKLTAPMGIPKEEKRYTSDPYREPLQ